MIRTNANGTHPIRRPVLFFWSLDGRILLSKLSREGFNAISNALELILLLGGHLAALHGGIVVEVAPLDLHGVEVDLCVEAVDVL